jgi:hypothetical protein
MPMSAELWARLVRVALRITALGVALDGDGDDDGEAEGDDEHAVPQSPTATIDPNNPILRDMVAFLERRGSDSSRDFRRVRCTHRYRTTTGVP